MRFTVSSKYFMANASSTLKRSHSPDSSMSNTKKMRQPVPFRPNKISTPEAASEVDRDPPLQILLKAVHNGIPEATESKSVVYWMRMGDLRGKLLFTKWLTAKLTQYHSCG